MSLDAGTHLGPYEIVAPLGAGGMGEVYRAKDTRLKREVAIKVLPERLAKDREALSRFEREAQAVAALSHPNIMAIHDVGRENDTSYVVTELLDGETLRERVRRSSIPWRKAVEIGTAIADGLAAAHAKGIVHRDLKPDNIFLTKDGVVKILDFGLAHVETTTSGAPAADQADTPTMTLDTRPGTILGTINYMSPEQVRGQKTDARSDIFSFGCVLYEMVTGRRAFTGDSPPETMTAILKHHPPDMTESGVKTVPELDRVIRRCLEKKSDQRIHSARDLGFALRDILSDSGAAKPLPAGAATWAGKAVWIAVGAVVVLLAGLAYVLQWGGAGVQPGETIDSLAVMPFVIAGGDPDAEYLGEEIPATIIDSMSQLSGLRVVPRSTVFRLARDRTDHRQIAKELGVRAILSGEVSQHGDRLSVRVALVDARSDRQLWGERYDRTEDDILAIEKDIAKRICEALRVRLTGEQKTELVRSYTDNTQAYRAYKEARFWWGKRTEAGFSRAIALYDDAIRIDPNYALAYAGKADSYLLLGVYHYVRPRGAFPQALLAVQTALLIDNALAEAHTALGGIRIWSEWDWDGAETAFRRAIELAPKYPTAHHWYGWYLMAMQRHEEAAREMQRAQQLDPGSLIINRDVGTQYLFSRQLDRAIVQFRRTIEMDPNFATARLFLGQALRQKQLYEEAIAEFQKTIDLVGLVLEVVGDLAYTYALADRVDEALAELRRLTELSKERYVPAGSFALIHIGLGNKDQAFEWLEKAYENREYMVPLLNVSPAYDSLRSDPRFDDLLRRVGLEGVSPMRPAPGLAVKSKTGKVKLVVLPFKDISPAPEAWFADGLTETLIGQLSRLSPDRLSVIASTTAMQYKGTDKGVRQIGRELNIDYAVEGRVQRIGDRVRIFAKLVRAGDETLIWSQDYDRKIDDVFALQSEVAGRIAEAIQIKLTPAEEAQLARARPVERDALDAYLQGLALAKDGTEQACKSALKMFDQAIESDPKFALAHVGRAKAFVTLGEYHVQPFKAMPYAKTAALDALALDDSLPEALTALAYVQMMFEWDFATAGETFKRAMELDGSSTDARLGYAEYLTAMKRGDEAIDQLDWVREHDPASVYTHEYHGIVAFMARRFDRVIRDCSAAIDVDPEFWKARTWLGMAHAQRGNFAEGIHHLRKARSQSDNSPVVAAMLGSVLAVSGEREEAREIVEALKENERDAYVCPYELATIWIGLDDHDEAFAEMDRACDGRAPCMPWLQVDPRLDPIRPDPRFDRLLRRVGFEQDSKLGLVEAAEPEKIMLAVLPFENLGSPGDEYFADGISDEIRSRLAAVRKLGVISRASAFQYRQSQTRKPNRQIGSELGVDYLIDGTIRWDRRSGGAGRVRITPELIRVSDDSQIWSQAYNRVIEDIFEVQSDIAGQVIKQLKITLLEPERQAIEAKPTENLDAYQAHLRGLDYVERPDYAEEDYRLAIRMFERAVRLDPDFALAYAGLSKAHSGMHHFGYDTTESRATKAKAAADRAFELQPELPEAHLALGYYHYWCHRDYDQALEELALAEKGLPNDSRILKAAGYVRRRQGNSKVALDRLTSALELSPRDASLAFEIGGNYTLLRRYAEADDYYGRSISLVPDQMSAYMVKARNYWLWKGDLKRARATLEEMPTSLSDEALWTWFWEEVFERKYQAALDRLALKSGESLEYQFCVIPKAQLAGLVYSLVDEPERSWASYDAARILLEEALQERPDDHRLHSSLGIVYAGLGRKEEAIREGKLGVELLPVSKDAMIGPYRVENLAFIYALVGEYEAALDRIEYLLSIPSPFSVPLLRLDPRWDPLRDHPRYKALLRRDGAEPEREVSP